MIPGWAWAGLLVSMWDWAQRMRRGAAILGAHVDVVEAS